MPNGDFAFSFVQSSSSANAGNADGTKQSTIESDAYFELLVKRLWGLEQLTAHGVALARGGAATPTVTCGAIEAARATCAGLYKATKDPAYLGRVAALAAVEAARAAVFFSRRFPRRPAGPRRPGRGRGARTRGAARAATDADRCGVAVR